MMILEMVGGRKKCTAQEEERTSEIYLPHWVSKHAESDGNSRSFRAMTEVEEEIARRMVLVGSWCMQTRPSDDEGAGSVRRTDHRVARYHRCQFSLLPQYQPCVPPSQKMVSVVTTS
ncbi:hypothetical protein B296_00051522 [Ensete ventricosum]|uniref:Uncharacterized protein n=1 Tax=Ensete ventricosum TaxID=4639 RepID=A0A426XT83_ENSVE|nr:hypothetical protein B296_00051522 [Ensete ventricosum]